MSLLDKIIDKFICNRYIYNKLKKRMEELEEQNRIKEDFKLKVKNTVKLLVEKNKLFGFYDEYKLGGKTWYLTYHTDKLLSEDVSYLKYWICNTIQERGAYHSDGTENRIIQDDLKNELKKWDLNILFVEVIEKRSDGEKDKKYEFLEVSKTFELDVKSRSYDFAKF